MSLSKITLQTISAYPGKLTELAANPNFAPTPFRPYAIGKNNDALVSSVSDFLRFLDKNTVDPANVETHNTSSFHNTLRDMCSPEQQDWWPEGADFKILTFASRHDKDPACMVLISPAMRREFEAATSSSVSSENDYTMPCSHAKCLWDHQDTALPGHVMPNAQQFARNFSEIGELVKDDMIVWRPDRSVAAVACDTALQLKANLLNGRGDIITDVPVKEFSTRPQQHITKAIEEGLFLRIGHPANNRRKTPEHLFTVIPWYAANTLAIDESGTVETVKTPRCVTPVYNINALVRTDFKSLHLTLTPPTERIKGRRPKMVLPEDQQCVISSALSPDEDKTVMIQGRPFKAVNSSDVEQLELNTRNFPMVFDTHADFRSMVTPLGKVLHPQLVLGQAQHIATLATKSAEAVTIRAAGQDFHFVPEQ